MIGSGELLIIGVLFLTTLNCLVTYLFSSYAVKKASVENDYSGAIKSLRIYDRYLFTPLTMLSAIAYVALSYNYFIEILEVSDYFITFATIGGFIFTLVTTFFSRLCYCYACNFVLKTKLNEYECFMVNDGVVTCNYIAMTVMFELAMIKYHTNLEINIDSEDDYDALQEFRNDIQDEYSADYIECQTLFDGMKRELYSQYSIESSIARLSNRFSDGIAGLVDTVSKKVDSFDMSSFGFDNENIGKFKELLNKYGK